jgi:hypothetical protein
MICRTGRPYGTAWAAIVTVLLIGCSGSSTAPPARGSIRLTVTTGANIDADGSELDLFGPSNRVLTIQANSEVLLEELTHGQYELPLKDVATNCAVDGANPVSATVVFGDTVPADFGLTCQ